MSLLTELVFQFGGVCYKHPAPNGADLMARRKKKSRTRIRPTDELRCEYDLSQLKGGVRGKYLR